MSIFFYQPINSHVTISMYTQEQKDIIIAISYNILVGRTHNGEH